MRRRPSDAENHPPLIAGQRRGEPSRLREPVTGSGGGARYLLGGGTVVAGIGIATAGPWLIGGVLVLTVFAVCTGLLFGYLPTVGPDGLGWQRVGTRKRARG